MANNRLRSGRPTVLYRSPDLNWWSTTFNQPNTKLGMRPRIGGSKGKSPAKPNERLAEAFGSTANPGPFLAVQKSINLAKSKIMRIQDPVGLDRIRGLVKKAVALDTPQAVDRLFSTIQVVSKSDTPKLDDNTDD